MYTFSNRLKIGSIALVIIGLLMVTWGFVDSHRYKTVEDVKVMLAEEAASHGDGHGDDHAEPAHDDGTHENVDSHGESSHGEASADHGDEHAEHVMHQIHNRPYAALYVAAFFFMMIVFVRVLPSTTCHLFLQHLNLQFRVLLIMDFVSCCCHRCCCCYYYHYLLLLLVTNEKLSL